MQVSGLYLLAQLVALAQPLAYARSASSTRPAIGPGLKVTNLEIRLTSSTRSTTGPCSPNE